MAKEIKIPSSFFLFFHNTIHIHRSTTDTHTQKQKSKISRKNLKCHQSTTTQSHENQAILFMSCKKNKKIKKRGFFFPNIFSSMLCFSGIFSWTFNFRRFNLSQLSGQPHTKSNYTSRCFTDKYRELASEYALCSSLPHQQILIHT